MPEQISGEHPIPERPEPDQSAAEETREASEHFLASILGKLSVRQAEVIRMRYHPDGKVALSRTAIAQYFKVSENAIRDIERRVWRDHPDLEPEPTPLEEYMRPARGPREKAPRDRPESYTLGEVEVTLSVIELQVMSRRYNSEGKVIAEQKEVAQQLGMSQGNLSKIERRVLNDFPELAGVIQATKAAEAAKRKRTRRRVKPKNETTGSAPKPEKEKKPVPPKPLVDPKYDPESYTAGIDLGSLYDMSKPPDDEK